MNPFLVFPVPDELPIMPKRLYARVDDLVESGKTGMHRYRFGGVNADWFDTASVGVVGTRGPTRITALETMPVFFLELETISPLDDLKFDWQGMSFDIDEWLQIVLTPGDNSLIFRNLYVGGQPISISFVSRPPSTTTAALDEAHDLDEWVTGDDDVTTFLNGLPSPVIDRFAVYDVGQGGANGLSGTADKPLIYFDFGGGTATHTTTRPHSAPVFCLCADPLMLLSHWDADHWSSAPLVAASLSRDWIAPYQWITSPHIVFVGTIVSAGGTLRVSKAAPGTVFSFGNARLHRANGTAKSRNDSGFFLVVHPSTSGEPFFFPADADYAHTVGMPSTAAGIVATHHGGNWKSTTAPSSAGGGGATRAAYSFGIFSAVKSNSYGHPTTRSVTDHTAAGFSTLDTPLRNGTGRSGNNTGHVYLDWAGAAVPTAPCGLAACYQNLDQS
jgi:hypothetical protein